MKTLPRESLIVGTRKSQLARWQAERVVELLEQAWPGLECKPHYIVTDGDQITDTPLPDFGGVGAFTSRLERALEEGSIDVAVHSLKDLPTTDAGSLTIGAILNRADTRDALIARNHFTLATLPPRAVVGTSSTRRQAQLLAARPDLVMRPIRGNVETRIRKVTDGHYDATVLAVAGLERLGLTDHISEYLSPDIMLPAPGQAALAIQCRADDTATFDMLSALDDQRHRAEVTAERAFLAALGGGCALPIAALATADDESRIRLRGLVASPDGRRIVRVEGHGQDAASLGRELATRAVDEGAAEILERAGEWRIGGPLDGKRIVVTRAAHQAESFVRRLAELGAQPIAIPVIRIEPLEDHGPIDGLIDGLAPLAPRASRASFDWLVFTSSNAVEVFFDRLTTRALDASALGGVRIAAVGPVTAEVLERRGARPDAVPPEFIGESVAEALGDVSGLRIALPRAQIARRTVVEMLEARGAVVTDVAIYRTLPKDFSSEAIEHLRNGADAVTFTSGSTVRNFVAALEKTERSKDFFNDTLVACIGPATADTARAIGLDVGLVPKEYTTAGLVDGLVQHFTEGRS